MQQMKRKLQLGLQRFAGEKSQLPGVSVIVKLYQSLSLEFLSPLVIHQILKGSGLLHKAVMHSMSRCFHLDSSLIPLICQYIVTQHKHLIQLGVRVSDFSLFSIQSHLNHFNSFFHMYIKLEEDHFNSNERQITGKCAETAN